MKIYEEMALRDFEFWGEAANNVAYFTATELEQLEGALEEVYYQEEYITATDLNDLFWFEKDWLAEILGYTNFDEIIERKEVE